MKIADIINRLTNHEISKFEAIEQITEITDGLRSKSALEYEVTYIAYTVESNHSVLHLTKRYGHNKVPKGLKTGDKVDVIFLP